PFGVLTKFTDEESRPTLADYVHISDIYAAGRLDLDSEGLLLLTDSGSLSHRLTDPRFQHPRTYWAQVEHLPDEAALKRLRAGVELSDGGRLWRTRPAQVDLLAAAPDLPDRNPPIRVRKSIPTAWLQLTITEGRNRQVRRMTAAVGCPMLRLVRWSIGTITLAGLAPGSLLPLTDAEIDALQKRILGR
ncbi:MAG: pseudouridine synthase, partial [Chloroflexota bacterium]